MSLADAIATQPPLLRLWVLWLTIALVVAPLILLAYRQSRRDGAVTLAASLGTVVFMQWLYSEVGFVRLLGLPHVLIWTPLAIYLGLRLRARSLTGVPRIAAGLFLATILVSLVFDYIDVARWLAGDRAPMSG